MCVGFLFIARIYNTQGETVQLGLSAYPFGDIAGTGNPAAARARDGGDYLFVGCQFNLRGGGILGEGAAGVALRCLGLWEEVQMWAGSFCFG